MRYSQIMSIKPISIFAAALVCAVFCMVLYVPVAEAKPKSEKRTDATDVSSGQPQKNVLVVEDVFAQENAEVLSFFEEDVFRDLSKAEKWDVLRTVMHLELAYLGCDPVRLKIKKLKDNSCLGYYTHAGKCIVLNERVLDRSAISCLKVLFHEIYHVYQHQCVDQLKEENFESSLKFFREIEQWEYESEHYADADGDSTAEEWERYRNQTLEVSADEYAQQRTDEYCRYLKVSGIWTGQE